MLMNIANHECLLDIFLIKKTGKKSSKKISKNKENENTFTLFSIKNVERVSGNF